MAVFDVKKSRIDFLSSLYPSQNLMLGKFLPKSNLLLFLSKQSKLFVTDICRGIHVHERCMSNQVISSMTFNPIQQHLAYSKGASSIWLLDLDNYTKAAKLNSAVKGNITEMDFIDDFLLLTDSTGCVSVVDVNRDQLLCVYDMEGSIDCLNINKNMVTMLVDGHLARLLLHNGRYMDTSANWEEQNEFVRDIWKALNNTLSSSEGFMGYLGLSVHERIQWGLEPSPLPANCVIL